jgi:hypothetical protein
MMIHVEQRLTVEAFLAAMKRRYGDLPRFRAYVRTHPRDVAAKLDLEDFEFYKDRPELRPEAMERAVSLIPVDGKALSVFTKQRLALLDALARGPFDSMRQLARHLGRDVHNVHADLQLLQTLGLVAFERGPRNRRVPRLAADSIRLVVGPVSVAPHGLHERERRIPETEEFVPLDEA